MDELGAGIDLNNGDFNGTEAVVVVVVVGAVSSTNLKLLLELEKITLGIFGNSSKIFSILLVLLNVLDSNKK